MWRFFNLLIDHPLSLFATHNMIMKTVIMPTNDRKNQKKTSCPPSRREKRRHLRKPIKLNVRLHDGQALEEKKARDISLSGMFVETTDSIAPGNDIQLSIPFSNYYNHYIKMRGKVVRCADSGIGIEFDIYSIDIE